MHEEKQEGVDKHYNMGSNSLVPHEMDTRIGVKRIGMHTPPPPVCMFITGTLALLDCWNWLSVW